MKPTPHINLFLLLLAVMALACQSPAGESEPATEEATDQPYIERLDAELDQLIPADAEIEVLAEGFEWTEGPVWIPDGKYVLFSDIPRNSVFKWQEGAGKSLYLTPSGYTGSEARGGESGSNGLLLSPEGKLVLCQHGDRRIAYMDAPLDAPAPQFVTLADKWEGKRFNSPNDATYHSSGALYFTDPPYGLEKNVDDPAKEIPFQGVFRLATDGSVSLLTDEITRPNGIGFSPDESTLYVACSDPQKAVWMAYDVQEDGSIANGRVFFDATQWVGKEKGLPDGMAIDAQGYIWATGPGGVLIFHPDGRHLGTIHTQQATANCTFGDNGKSLYITADMYLMRVKLF